MLNQRSLKAWALLFVTPNLIHFVLFFAIPAILGLWYSFTNYDGFANIDFIGIENYQKLFTDKLFYQVIGNTFIYTIILVPLVILFSFMIAIVLSNEGLFTKSWIRSLVYWPTLLSSVMIGITWKWIFSENYGVLNYVLSELGINEVAWQSSTIPAFFTIIVAALWSSIGFNMLIYIGAIKNIPKSHLEAADIDGAGYWRKIRHVIFPGVSKTTILIMVLTTINAFKEFALIVTMTNGGPGKDTQLIVQYIYNLGFDQNDVGYASAVSMIMVVILMIISFFQLKLERVGE